MFGKHQTCKGDSGSWILEKNSNSLLGMLWGWSDGCLLFTPIHDIFADIRESVPEWHDAIIKLPTPDPIPS